MFRPVFIGLLWVGLLSGSLCQAAFKDPLQTPAMPTSRVTDAPMTAITQAGPGHLVAVGWRGVIIWSEDNGKSWQQAAVPVREDLTSVSFPTPKHGWAVGQDGVVLESTDGGKSWLKNLDGNAAAKLMSSKYEKLVQTEANNEKVLSALKEARGYLAQAPARPFLGVAFESDSTGYLLGTFNLIFRTTDAGKTWEPVYEKTQNPDAYNLYAMGFQNNNIFLVGELGLVLQLDRQKDQFLPVSVPYQGSFFSLASKPTVLIVCGLRGNAFRSTDGGASWQKIAFDSPAPGSFVGTTVLEDGQIVAVTVSGDLMASGDDGQHFRRIQALAPMAYSGVAAVGRNTVAVVGAQGVRIETIR